MNVMGIIFANDGALGELTGNRTMASLPFGGRYRQVDFHLSNMAAAGIRRIGIVTRHNYQSLMNHIGSGEEWGLELEEGGLEYLTPFATSDTHSYRGKLESLHAAMIFLKCVPEDEYVVMADSAILSNLDVSQIIQNHIESGKDVTVVAKEGICNSHKQIDLALKLDARGEVMDMAVDYVASPDYLASMDVFVLSKNFLLKNVQELIARNLFHMDRDLVLGQWQQGKLSVNVFLHEGVALYNDTTEEYFLNSLSLIGKEIRHDLFGRNHPVFTKVRDRVPTYYGEDCQIENCLIADGCMLEGQAQDSILFRNVSICPGAQVESCVVMNDTVVGEGSQLKYAILDKDVVVRPGARLCGTPKNPIIIKRGEIV